MNKFFQEIIKGKTEVSKDFFKYIGNDKVGEFANKPFREQIGDLLAFCWDKHNLSVHCDEYNYHIWFRDVTTEKAKQSIKQCGYPRFGNSSNDEKGRKYSYEEIYFLAIHFIFETIERPF